MSEEDGRKMKTSSSSDDKKKKRRKKRKRRKKLGAPHTPQQAAPADLKPAEPTRVTPVPRGRTPKRRAACKKSKEPPREPPLPPTSDGELKEAHPAGARLPPPTPSPTPPPPPDVPVRECLRWEGALQDPRAEEERLEAYRVNRRRRYAAQRDAPPPATLARAPALPLSHRAL